MKIKGLQKLTLLDYPGKIACTVFLAGCNFRCPFCHNASLVVKIDEDYINEEEFFAFLEKRKGMLEGVCVTGGEPTLQSELPSFLAKIKALGYLVKLDTNGYRPDTLRQVVSAGLVDFVAMDIKNSKEKYDETVGVENFDISPILESVEFLLSGGVPYEFRTTVVKGLHTETDIEKISEWIAGASSYHIQSFADSGDLIGEGFDKYDKNTLANMVKIAKSKISVVTLRGV